ncbi:ATP-binding protein [Streptomyces sp. NPDC047315]|uniref:ATP-binding protein n=1 Tax=Streptomyces sp. NPDC047315 TaxID=3155142 RepID=UPI0033E08DE6
MLRLPTIRSQFPDLAETASREQMYYLGFLAELLLAECDDRARRRSECRIKAAGFPRDKSLRKFDFEANPNIDAAVIHTLAKRGWTKTFTDSRLCTTIADRLTFGGNIIETGTDSYRLATTRARAEQQAVV